MGSSELMARQNGEVHEDYAERQFTDRERAHAYWLIRKVMEEGCKPLKEKIDDLIQGLHSPGFREHSGSTTCQPAEAHSFVGIGSRPGKSLKSATSGCIDCEIVVVAELNAKDDRICYYELPTWTFKGRTIRNYPGRTTLQDLRSIKSGSGIVIPDCFFQVIFHTELFPPFVLTLLKGTKLQEPPGMPGYQSGPLPKRPTPLQNTEEEIHVVVEYVNQAVDEPGHALEDLTVSNQAALPMYDRYQEVFRHVLDDIKVRNQKSLSELIASRGEASSTQEVFAAQSSHQQSSARITYPDRPSRMPLHQNHLPRDHPPKNTYLGNCRCSRRRMSSGSKSLKESHGVCCKLHRTHRQNGLHAIDQP